MSKESHSQLEWIDNLRALATVSVIALHVSSPVVHNFGNIPASFWWAGNIYDSFTRFCVPIFLMITGVLILPKDYSISDFFKKRFVRVILPFAFWSVVYVLYVLYLRHINNADLALMETAKYVFSLLKDGGQTAFHFWYLYMLLGLYLAFPVLGKWVRNSNIKELQYFLAIWGLVILLDMPYISKLKPNINFAYFSGHIGYVVLGYYLSIPEVSNKIKSCGLLLFGVGLIIAIFGTYFIINSTNSDIELFYGNLAPNVLLMATGVFMFFQTFSIANRKLLTAIQFVSNYSFGIYLVHVLVLNTLGSCGFNTQFTHPLISIPVVTIFCTVVSGLIIYLLRKLPFGGYFAG